MRSRGLTQGSPSALAGPETLARGVGVRDLLRLGSNESPYGPSPRALAAIAAQTAHASRYGDPATHDLREAIASYHRIAPENVSVGAGIDELLGTVMRAYAPPGTPTITTLGGFPTFEMHAIGYETSLTRVPYLSSARIDLDGFVEAAKATDGALIFLPNPDNPTGSHIAWRDVLAFVDALPENSLVVHDEAYANFVPAHERAPENYIDPRMIRMRTFSKEYGLASLRVAYALGTREAIAALEAIRLWYGVNRFAQAAASASLADRLYVSDVVGKIAAERETYYALGEKLGLPTLPSTANFVLFDCGTVERAVAIVNDLMRRGIHIRKPSAPPLDHYIRISVGTPQQTKRLTLALEASLVTA